MAATTARSRTEQTNKQMPHRHACLCTISSPFPEEWRERSDVEVENVSDSVEQTKERVLQKKIAAGPGYMPNRHRTNSKIRNTGEEKRRFEWKTTLRAICLMTGRLSQWKWMSKYLSIGHPGPSLLKNPFSFVADRSASVVPMVGERPTPAFSAF